LLEFKQNYMRDGRIDMARILVIDDEVQIQDLMAEFLMREGHQVDKAGNGKIGLKLAGQNVYDLVITDVVMPEQDGYEVIMRLVRTSPKVKIIVMTGGAPKLDTQNLLKTAKLMGADGALPKPIDFSTFKTVVNDVLALEK